MKHSPGSPATNSPGSPAIKVVPNYSMQPASQPEAVFHPEFRKDLEYFVIYQRKVAKKAFKIVEAILRDPFNGQGKPKPLKHFGSNVWSRNLTQEDRIVYRVEHGRVEFLQCRFHYSQ